MAQSDPARAFCAVDFSCLMIMTFFDASFKACLLLIVAFLTFASWILELGHCIYTFHICIRVLELFLTFQTFTTLVTVVRKPPVSSLFS